MIAALCATVPARPDAPGFTESTLVYGHSVRGRPLVAYILGTGTNVTLVSGGVHGNEFAAPGLVRLFKAYLEENPAELAGKTVVIVPNVNPDGDDAGTRANADGVDLNRNFPYQWAPKRRGITLSPGTHALSEPEAQGLVALLDKTHPSKIVSVHWPFHTMVWSGPQGKVLASTMIALNHYPTTDNVGYPTPGSFGGYCYHVRHIACVTLELPVESAAKAWEQNKEALRAAIALKVPANEPL